MGDQTRCQTSPHEVHNFQTTPTPSSQLKPHPQKKRIPSNREIQATQRVNAKSSVQPLLGYGVEPSHSQSLDGH